MGHLSVIRQTSKCWTEAPDGPFRNGSIVGRGSVNIAVIFFQRLGVLNGLGFTHLSELRSPVEMDTTKDSKQRQEAPWWGICILYLMLAPFAVLGFFAFKALAFVWRYFDGTTTAIYAFVAFAIAGGLIASYLVMVVHQIYIEFVVPKLADTTSSARQPKDSN